MTATTPFPPTPDLAPAEPRSSWWLRAAFAVVGAVILAELVVVGGLVAYTLLLVGEEPAASAPEPGPQMAERLEAPAGGVAVADDAHVWDRHGPVNILLLGRDNDVCASPGTPVLADKTDTMILVRVDPAAKAARMMSLPRDLYVHVQGYGGKKLTMAHFLGELQRETYGGGPQLLKVVIRDNFQIPVHRFVRVDFAGFERIVDAVGPITVDVPASPNDPAVGLHDENYPGENCTYTTIDFPPGVQEMDGAHALQYARSRYSTSDFDRSRRQMQVLMAIRERVLRPGILLDLHRLVPSLMATVDTDLSVPEILSLGVVARGIGAERIERLAIDENVVYDDTMVIDNTPQFILQRDPAAWDLLRRRFLGLDAPAAAAPAGG